MTARAKAALGLGVWAVLVLAGSVSLARYAGESGERGHTPARWPQVSPLWLHAQQPTLVAFMHPRCPCTRATMSELERLVARVGGHVHGYVLFFVPAGEGPSWAEGALWRRADALPGVTPLVDVQGRISQMFGAQTSGHVAVYGASGQLRFSGGLTASRGHEGMNQGLARAERALASRGTATESHVFGCPIHRAEADGTGR